MQNTRVLGKAVFAANDGRVSPSTDKGLFADGDRTSQKVTA